MPMLARVRAAILAVALLAAPAAAQGLAEDYARAEGLRDRFVNLVTGVVDEPAFTSDSKALVYRKLEPNGEYAFYSVDLATLAIAPAFDQQRLAQGLGVAASRTFEPRRLPFPRYTLSADRAEMDFTAAGSRWKCLTADYTCKLVSRVQPPEFPSNGMGPRRALNDRRDRRDGPDSFRSPDQKLDAFVRDWNLFVRDAGGGNVRQLSFDGGPDSYYVVTTTSWSPDSKQLAVSRTRPGFERYINYIESSPDDQKQPKLTELYYQKPGDQLTDRQPVLFDVGTGAQIVVDRTLFPNAYSQTEPRWWNDGRGFYISYNQRGHQVYRIIEVNRQGAARAIIDEQAKTYIEYSSKRVFEPINDGREIIWMSERDGWCHLYLYDGVTGRVKRQITKGEWAVRAVVHVDKDKRQITFTANGMRPGEDPYFVHFYRINFDGTGLTHLTDAAGTHSVTFSPDRKFYVDIFSRVDMAPVAQLRRTEDAAVLMELGRGEIGGLLAAGWTAPEPFVAKGRDGVTDIHGVIIKPTNFDPAKRYPIVETIYAGPQGAFVPKSFATYRALSAQAELGFIVVQIDGMGTNYRSKAFHDVAWKNLADGGFPDRKLWHRAVAAKYPWYDISRVGIYGGSAGGQNAMAALLFHPDFYDAAVAFAGSHDNRMDKIWWNEQYMGWPIGPEYSASSNVDNAHKLQGKLMLVVGELDTNVDPSSTFQVVNALIRANKTFDFLFLPGEGHNEGGRYGERKRWDFFVKHLIGAEPPDRNVVKAAELEQQEDEPIGASSSP